MLNIFNTLKPYTISMAQFHYILSNESDQYASTTETHICILLQFLFRTGMIAPFLTTMWYHTYGCAKHYRFAPAIYLLSCLDLEFHIVIDRSVRSPGHGKDVV